VFITSQCESDNVRRRLPHTSKIIRSTSDALARLVLSQRVSRASLRTSNVWIVPTLVDCSQVCFQNPFHVLRFYDLPCGCGAIVVSASDCGVTGPRFESHRGRLCLSRQLLRYTALGTDCAPLLQCLGRPYKILQ